jgi:acetyltransferase-like isoleucine patch superfamily enzyme
MNLGEGFLALYAFIRRLYAKTFTALCRSAFRELGRRSIIMLPVRLRGAKRISIGERVFIGANSWLYALGSGVDEDDPMITIGDGTEIAGFCTITAAQRVIIEDNVLIARYVYISDHSHAHRSRSKPILLQGITNARAVRIGAGAWLGQSVVICPGVTIGRGAVIGANSVVRADVPDYSVAGGVPARVTRMIDEESGN